MFGRGPATFDRIDLAMKPGTSPEDGKARARRAAGAGRSTSQRPASRANQAEAMLSGYTMMVNLSSAFALFIGMFIVYNSFCHGG